MARTPARVAGPSQSGASARIDVAQLQGVCVSAPMGCGQPITGFRDPLSVAEYRLSGLCQKCQDVVFAELDYGDSDEADRPF